MTQYYLHESLISISPLIYSVTSRVPTYVGGGHHVANDEALNSEWRKDVLDKGIVRWIGGDIRVSGLYVRLRFNAS